MTDRIKGFIVILDEDIREDDAEPIANAIRQLNHVASVEGSVRNIEDTMNRSRIRMELERQLWAVLHPPQP